MNHLAEHNGNGIARYCQHIKKSRDVNFLPSQTKCPCAGDCPTHPPPRPEDLRIAPFHATYPGLPGGLVMRFLVRPLWNGWEAKLLWKSVGCFLFLVDWFHLSWFKTDVHSSTLMRCRFFFRVARLVPPRKKQFQDVQISVGIKLCLPKNGHQIRLIKLSSNIHKSKVVSFGKD